MLEHGDNNIKVFCQLFSDQEDQLWCVHVFNSLSVN